MHFWIFECYPFLLLGVLALIGWALWDEKNPPSAGT